MPELFAFVAALGVLFFAVVDMAFTLFMRLPQRLEAERASEDDALVAYLDDPLKFFVPARLMRGAMIVLLMVLLAQRMDPGFTGGLVMFGIGLVVTLGVGQILPAFIVRRSPERVLALLLPPFTAVANVLAPFSALIIGRLGPVSSPAAATTTGGQPAASVVTAVPQRVDENRLLQSVVDFGDTLVREVMTPRPDIVAIQASATIEDLRKLVQEQEYSRLPVYTENLDNITGLVVVKDLIQKIDALTAGMKVTDIMRPAAFVPETKRVADVLREFQKGRFQLAIVVDEYGGTAGLVTVEDVVEELVGEIRDEYDSEAEPIVRESDETFVFSAKVAIRDMMDRLAIEIEDGGFETVGGYVLTRVGRVPAVGEQFMFDGLNVEILEAERRRIHKLRIRRLPPPAEDASE